MNYIKLYCSKLELDFLINLDKPDAIIKEEKNGKYTISFLMDDGTLSIYFNTGAEALAAAKLIAAKVLSNESSGCDVGVK